MTAALIILAAVVLILLIPIGVSGGWDFGEIGLTILVGPLKLRLLPKKPPKPGKEKKPKAPKAKKDKPKKPRGSITFQTITDYARLGVRALGRFRRRLCIRKLKIWYLAAASDPCDAAVAYGRANAAIAELLSLLHAAFEVKEQDVRLRVDFSEEKSQFSVGGELTIRFGQILFVGLCALIDFLKIMIKQRKKAKLNSERNDENGEASHRRDDGNNDVEDQGNGGREHDRGHAYHNA